MTQQPFSRPGAIDLSALKQTAAPRPGAPAAAGGAGAPGQGQAGPGAAGAVGAYAEQVDEQTFQTIVEASMTAPVVLVFYSPTQSAESTTMAADVAQVADEYDGRFLAGLVDIDAEAGIAQAMQIPSVPLMMVLLDGRPVTQPIPGVVPIDDLRALFNQLAQQLTAQGITGRHQPSAGGATGTAAAPDGAAGAEGAEEEPATDPRFEPAEDKLAAGDYAGAVAAYQALVDANPADAEAAHRLAMAQVLQRTDGVDLNAAREAAAAAPDDVDAQILVADLDLLGGHVDDAFGRLITFVQRHPGPERDRAREHLIGLFGAVGNEDPRVLTGRRNLANALF